MSELRSLVENKLLNLIEELRQHMSDFSYQMAREYAQRNEADLAMESIAYVVASLDVPWNRESFSEMARLLDRDPDRYLTEARDFRQGQTPL